MLPRRWSWRTLERAAASLILAPLIGLVAIMALRPGPSVDDGISVHLPRLALPRAAPEIDTGRLATLPRGSIQLAALSYPLEAPRVPAPVISLPRLTLPITAPQVPPPPGSITFSALSLPTGPPRIDRISGSIRFAALSLPLTPPEIEAPARLPADALLTPLPPVAQCSPGDRSMANGPQLFAPTPEVQALDSTAFGHKLAEAAAAQVASFVVYDARYTRIAYPGGDVAPLYGVCTDVVIRAYRALGTDLQAELQQSGMGRGDPSIDHRRTEALRRFLARFGQDLPVSEFAEDYLPGDIVTYYRPQNRSSTAHIAIVSARLGPSGRPMIIHNRGHGVQEEDALFVDRVTGHYRYRPSPTAIAALRTRAPVSRPKPASVVTRVAQPRPPAQVAVPASRPLALTATSSIR